MTPSTQPFPHYTCSGKEVWFLLPGLTALDLDEDFGPTLGRIYRYGAALGDITDLDHLALCVVLADLHFPRAANLLRIRGYAGAHDLHEAIVLDVPAPLKPLLPEYARIEHLWAVRTHACIGLGRLPMGDAEQAVTRLDRRASAIEMAYMNHPNRALQWEIAGGPPSFVERAGFDAVRALSPAGRWALIRSAIVDAREAS